MTRRLISSGSKFEQDIGYSRAVVDGEWVFVSGTTGFNYATMTIDDDVVAQCEQTLENIKAALGKAGATFKDVVRVHYLITKAKTSNVAGPWSARRSVTCALPSSSWW